MGTAFRVFPPGSEERGSFGVDLGLTSHSTEGPVFAGPSWTLLCSRQHRGKPRSEEGKASVSVSYGGRVRWSEVRANVRPGRRWSRLCGQRWFCSRCDIAITSGPRRRGACSPLAHSVESTLCSL